MNLINRSLSALIFSVGKGGYSTADAPLPADALVIVIQNSSDLTAVAPPLLQLPDYHRSGYKLPAAPSLSAGKAYSGRPQVRIPTINVSG